MLRRPIYSFVSFVLSAVVTGCSIVRPQQSTPMWILNPISDSSAQYFCIESASGKLLYAGKCQNLPMEIGGSIDKPESGYCTKDTATRVLTCNRPFWANDPQWNGKRWVMPAERQRS